MGRQPAGAGCPQPSPEGSGVANPVIKMGFLLGRSPAVATLALQVVPAGVPLRGPDMSWDMRLVAVSDETADSDGFESMAEGLSDPLG